MTVTYDPKRHCGARTRRPGSHPECVQVKGWRTDHKGSGNCYLHLGNTPNGKKAAAREARFAEVLDTIAGVALTDLAGRLARLAFAGAVSIDSADHEDFSRAVSAFAKAAERAEGSKLTLEGRIDILAGVPEDEAAAALAEIERMLAAARHKALAAE